MKLKFRIGKKASHQKESQSQSFDAKNDSNRRSILDERRELEDDVQREPEDQEEMIVPDNIFGQFWLCIKLSVGPIISMIFYMIVQLINTYYIGHTNEPVLIAGVGMGNMLINVLAFATMQGMNGALETLISQAYGASKNK